MAARSEQPEVAKRRRKGHAELVVYNSGSHSKHRLLYHLVWIPKYRRRVLRGKIANRLYELFRQCAEMNRWKIEELQIMEEHVHMLVQLPPSVALSKVVQMFKGGSSRVIRMEHPELEEFLWGDSFWADGYFAETVGRTHEDAIRNYIREQQVQHANEAEAPAFRPE